MFTDEQLEYIYGAVKSAHTECHIRTLRNDQQALALRGVDNKRMDKYKEIMNIINIHTDGEPVYNVKS